MPLKRRVLHSQPLPRGAALLSLLIVSLIAGPQAGGQTIPDERLDPGYRSEAPALPEDAPEVESSVTQVAPVSAPSVAISGIRFIGVEVPANVAAASEKFLGRPADTATLKELAAAMSAAYRKSDVALFTLAIPNQDLSDGIVDVHIAEGHLADVQITKEGAPVERRRLRGYLKPALSENPTTRAAFERGVTLARRTEGTTITPAMQMASTPGGVNLVLDVKEKRHEFAAGYDNRESQLLDSGRINFSAAGYSLLRQGDALRGRIAVTPDGHQSRSATLQYRTPIGIDGLSLALASAYQRTRPSSLDLTGEANFFSATLSYPLILGFNRELSVVAGIDRTENTNTALGSVIANERIPAARLALHGAHAFRTRSISGKIGVAQGLNIDAAKSSVTGSSTDFTKFDASLQAVQKLGDSVFLRARGTTQWSDDILPANERLLIGGADFGRGFNNGLIGFDKGYAVSLEPAWRPLSEGAFSRSELYIFADHADGRFTSDGITTRAYDLSSAGIGTRLAYKNYGMIGVEYAEPVNLPVKGMKDDPVITLSWSFQYQPE